MDIFTQKRYLIIVIVVLVILNLGTLLILWMGKPSRPKGKGGPSSPKQEQARLEQLLNKELGFDENQVQQYLKLRHDHQVQSRMLTERIRELKKQMFDEVFKEKPQQLSDSLLNLVQAKQAEIEQVTFQHFLDLKKLCKPEQQDKLKLLMHEVFRKNSPPGMNNENRPPPPPGGEGAPPPPRNN